MNKYIVYMPNGDAQFIKARSLKDVLNAFDLEFFGSLEDGYGFKGYSDGAYGLYIIRPASKSLMDYYGI